MPWSGSLLRSTCPNLDQRPIGKPFPEVYDPVTLKPLPEWQGVYEEVKAELSKWD